MVAGGLRVTDEGVAYNHHFLKINDASWAMGTNLSDATSSVLT
jgi:hypothetical protein